MMEQVGTSRSVCVTERKGSRMAKRERKTKKQSAPKPKSPGVAALNEIISSFKDAMKVQGRKIKDMRWEEVEDELYSFMAGIVQGRNNREINVGDEGTGGEVQGEEEAIARGYAESMEDEPLRGFGMDDDVDGG